MSKLKVLRKFSWVITSGPPPCSILVASLSLPGWTSTIISFPSSPDSIGNLVNLTALDLGANVLTALPDSIGNLTSLTTLYLGYNLLSTIPDSIGNLVNLTRLTLRGNTITVLPDSLGELSNLARLSIEDNALTNIGPEVLSAGTQAVLAFLKASQGATAPQWASKVLVVGDSSVGKTSLVRALLDQPHNPAEPTTHGLQIRIAACSSRRSRYDDGAVGLGFRWSGYLSCQPPVLPDRSLSVPAGLEQPFRRRPFEDTLLA